MLPIPVLPGTAAEAVAVETFAAFVVGAPPVVSGGFVAVPGTVQRVSVTPAVQLDAAAAVSVSLLLLPVSTDVLIKRLPVVLG